MQHCLNKNLSLLAFNDQQDSFTPTIHAAKMTLTMLVQINSRP